MLDRKDERGNSNENKKQAAGLTDPFQFLSFIVCILFLFFPLVLLKTLREYSKDFQMPVNRRTPASNSEPCHSSTQPAVFQRQ